MYFCLSEPENVITELRCFPNVNVPNVFGKTRQLSQFLSNFVISRERKSCRGFLGFSALVCYGSWLYVLLRLPVFLRECTKSRLLILVESKMKQNSHCNSSALLATLNSLPPIKNSNKNLGKVQENVDSTIYTNIPLLANEAHVRLF